jgi:hypothetical protein
MKQKMGLALPPAPAGAQPAQLGAGASAAAPPPHAEPTTAHDAEIVTDDGSAHTAQERNAFAPPPPPDATQAQGGLGANDRDLAAQIDALNRSA